MGVLPAVALGEEPVGYLLRLPPGARAIGMGMAQGAIAEEPDAGYWNPAALAFIEPEHAATFTYSRLDAFFDLTFPFVYAAYSERIGRHGAIALNFAYFDLGDIDSYELAPGVSYGGRVTDELAIGVGAKMYRIDSSPANEQPGYNYGANTVLFDIGVLWRGMDSRVHIGGAVQNLGPDLELGSVGSSYPAARNLKLATGARLVDLEAARLTAACDLDIPLAGEDNSPRLMLGGEMRVDWAALRIGLRYDGWALEDQEGLEERDKYATTIGFGVRVRGVNVDYANAPWDVLSIENSHHITVGVRF
jgi:hypothetical protein